jgi:hypothetical protein
MAKTIKFTASNGKRYSLLALSSKITTPSVKVGSSYIPCFSGSAGSDVASGEYIYTLAPFKVGSKRAAYKRRFEFVDNGKVYIQVQTCNSFGYMGGVVMTALAANWQGIHTNMSGYTATANVTSQSSMYHADLGAVSYTFWWKGTYSVKHDSTGAIVASGDFYIQAYDAASVIGGPYCTTHTLTVYGA